MDARFAALASRAFAMLRRLDSVFRSDLERPPLLLNSLWFIIHPAAIVSGSIRLSSILIAFDCHASGDAFYDRMPNAVPESPREGYR